MQANFHSLLTGPKFHLCCCWLATTTRKGKANLQSQEFVKPHDKSPCRQLKKRQWNCRFSSSVCTQTGEWPCSPSRGRASPSTWVGPRTGPCGSSPGQIALLALAWEAKRTLVEYFPGSTLTSHMRVHFLFFH